MGENPNLNSNMESNNASKTKKSMRLRNCSSPRRIRIVAFVFGKLCFCFHRFIRPS